MNFPKNTSVKNFVRLFPAGFILAIIISSLFHKCANIVPPTGGLRDTIPPRILSSTPPLYSTEVTPSTITIVFDEFIELKNLQQQFLISPPQEERPDIRQRGKLLTIDLKSELAPNTTYSLNFGNAVVDLNEGNPYGNFQFVFSTGKTIDSLTISGRVVSALEKNPEENVIVMLYLNHYDSVPFKEIPLYVTRTDKEGNFKLRYLRADSFKLFALKDINNNFLYDRPGSEAIAFLDTLIFPTGVEYFKTTLSDTLKTETEHDHEHEELHDHEQEADLDRETAGDLKSGGEIILRLFTEEVSLQYVSSASRPERNRLFLTFNKTMQKTPELSPLNFAPRKDWNILEASPKNDSLIVWITDSLVYQMDTLQLAVRFFDFLPDTVLSLQDTIRFTFLGPGERAPQRAPQQASPGQPVNINLRNGEIMELNKNIVFASRRPLELIDTSKISMIEIIDSLDVPVDFKLVQNQLYPRLYNLVGVLKEDSEYSITSLPGAFTDIHGNTSDTISVNFKTQKDTNYGSLILNIKEVNTYLIIQLLDDKDKVLIEKYISENSLIEFKHLKPQRYKLRAIADSNNNRKWDTGNYLLGIQPEKVIMFSDPITIRAAWELELSWDILNEK